MQDKLTGLKNDPLVRGSFVLFVMFGFYNILNYVFQISMARMLGPSDYGVLAVLMSIIYIFAIPGEAIQNFITKYIAALNAHGKLGKMKDLLMRSLSKGLFFATIIFIIYLILSPVIALFLKINIWLVIITGIMILSVFIVPITRGVLQGKKKFSPLGLNLVLESLTKVLLSILLVWLGWKVYGAITGVILGSAIAFIATFLSIKDIMKSQREREELVKIYRANLPLLVATISIVFMYSVDIILARRFFSSQVAGEFAFVSLIGKVIVFVSSSIGKAMFPLSSEEYEKGNGTAGLLKKSILLVSLMSLASLVIYYLFPKEIIYLISLGSSQYLGASGILFILGLAYSLISIANVIILYKISINKLGKGLSLPLLALALIEILLLSVFSSSLLSFSLALLFSGLLIFLYSLFLLKK